MASDDEEEDLEALRNAVLASMKRKPLVPDHSSHVRQPVLAISNPEKRPIAKPPSYSYHNQAASNYSHQRGGGGRSKPPFGRGRAGNTNLIVINTQPAKEDIAQSGPTVGGGSVFVDRRLETRAPGVAITSHISTPPRPKATGKFSRYNSSSSSDSEDSISDNDGSGSDQESSAHSDSPDEDPPGVTSDANESSGSDSKASKSSESSESSNSSESSDEESKVEVPAAEKSPPIKSNAVKSKARTSSPKEKSQKDGSVRYVVPPAADVLSDKSVIDKHGVSHERKIESCTDDRQSEKRRLSSERKAANSLKVKRAASPENIKPDSSSDRCIKPLMSKKELTTLAARKRKFDSSRIVGGEKNKKTISLKGIVPKKEKRDKLKRSKQKQKRKSLSPNRKVRKVNSEKLKKSKTPEGKRVLIHKSVASSDSEDSTEKSSSSNLSDSDSDSTSMRSSLKTERNRDDIARERRQRVTKTDRSVTDSGLTHNQSAFTNTSIRSHATHNYKEHRRKRFIEEIEDDERPRKRFVSCVVKPRSEDRKGVLASNRMVKEYHREKQWSSGSEGSGENRPTDRQTSRRHGDHQRQLKVDPRTRIHPDPRTSIHPEKPAEAGYRESVKSVPGRASPAINVTFNSDKSFQKDRPKVKRSVLERLGAPVKDGGGKRPVSPTSTSGQRRRGISNDEDYLATRGENARKHRMTEKEVDSASMGRKKSSQARKSSMSDTKETSRRNTSKAKGWIS